MAPTTFAHTSSPTSLAHITRSLSYLLSRSTDPNTIPPLASIFALIVRQSVGVVPRSSPSTSSLEIHPRTPAGSSDAYTNIFHPSSLEKRQTYILAIPTTYDGLNDGPEPGAVAGIVLGSIAGFILVLYIVLSLLKLYTGRTFVETRVVERQRRSHSHSHSRSRSRARSRSVSEVPRVRRERTVVEEHIERSRSRGPTEVVVEEEHDDIVEVFEEHSEEGNRRNRGSGSKRQSGYRVVDPAELGGGSRPMRKVSRR